ncbi:MAG: hypothetical protein JJU12_05820 [Chlamydiales bacterium]|nr:hypothetical protein [Chlamydiales bacterium]
MFLQRKALYNLLQINLPRIESGELKIGDLEPWQTENYRQQPTDMLLNRLSKLGISFGNGDFTAYALSFEEPEELLDAIAKERDPLEQDQVFLLIFELWRRHFPEKRTLSIFCDELDYQMTQYDLEHECEIADTLEYLLQILEENVDKGLNPIDVLQTIQTYCANDIESFLFDYILAEIEEGNRDYASELLDSFLPYIRERIWFDYLRARIDYIDDPEVGCRLFEKLIGKIGEATNIDLVEEILYFLADSGNHTLFYDLAIKMFDLMKVEEDFREFLEICYIHYDHLDLKEPGLVLSEIFHRRKTLSSESPLDPEDPDLAALRAVLDQKLHL